MKLLCTVKEASGTTGISVPTLRRAIYRGEIPVVRLGGCVRIPVAWVEQLVTAALDPFKDDGPAKNA